MAGNLSRKTEIIIRYTKQQSPVRVAAQDNLVKNVLSNYLDHFCRGNDEWLDGEVLDVSCHEVGVFFGKSHFVEHDVFGVRKVNAFG